MDEGSYEARKSAPKDRVEITTRTERRRRWSAEEKLRIVRETLHPGAVAQVIADQHGIGTGLLYTWRKQMLTVSAMAAAHCGAGRRYDRSHAWTRCCHRRCWLPMLRVLVR